MIKILLIEDDTEIIEILTEYLAKYNMEVFGFTHPKEALISLEIEYYDLVILDLSLPQMDGLDVCKEIYEKHNIPIIISTARSDTSDKIIGLGNGADDYLPKPYDLRELVARIQTILRRNTKQKAVAQDAFAIDSETMSISMNGNKLTLTLAEYQILKLFLNKRHTTLTREYIANNVEALGWESSDKSIDVIISRLRQKMGDTPKDSQFIKSIRGAGYRFIYGNA